ncbi:MAG: isochorismate synthase [Micropruina sp.]|nr:isochorismate synthase [Micropruina sp.]
MPVEGARKTRATTLAIPDPGGLERFLTGPDALAWIRRGEGMVGLGCHVCLEFDSLDAADAWWSAWVADLDHDTELPGICGSGPLAFGSFAFDPANSRHRSKLVVPSLIVGRRQGRSWVTRVGDGLPALPQVSDPPSQPVGVSVRADPIAEARWMGTVAEVVDRIERNGLSKVVLARAVRAVAAGPIDGRSLVGCLIEHYPSCWTYLFGGLVGASPEMLVRRERGLATSRILAGTIQRSGSEETDLKLAASLARSSKNLIEHELAVTSVAEALAPFCSGMNVPDAPYVLELPNVLHLATDVTGVAHSEASALQLAARLHPSAAVCGTPTSLARTTISELEGLDRGRYSGPVGWIDTAGDGEWAIALRCGVIDQDDPSAIDLFAGCGIVAGSDPTEELAETKAKLSPMLDALGATVS